MQRNLEKGKGRDSKKLPVKRGVRRSQKGQWEEIVAGDNNKNGMIKENWSESQGY